MHKILIVGEHDGKALNPATAKCVTCATGIPDAEISIALLGAAWIGRRMYIRWPRFSRRR
jgi:hypothetical protein